MTGEGADRYVSEQIATLAAVSTSLKHPADLVGQVEALQDELRAARKEVERLNLDQANQAARDLVTSAKQKDGYKLVAAELSLEDAKAAKSLAFQLEDQLSPAVVVLGLVSNGKPQLLVAISKSLTERPGFHAGQLVKSLAGDIGGGGGGQAFYASAGGSRAAGLSGAIARAEGLLAGI